MDGGFRNRNLLLEVDGEPRRAVLRLYDADPCACTKEAALLALLGPRIPVPRVQHIDAEPFDDWPPRLVLEYVDGIPLRELVVAGDARAIGEAARDAGRVLARVAAVGFAEPGFLRGDLTVDPTFGGVPASYRALIAHLTGRRVRERAGARIVTRVERFADAWGDRVDASGSSALVHGDFNSRNILVREDAGRWRVAAGLDWEFAMSGNLLVDVGNMLRYERDERPRFEPDFSDGLREGGLELEADWRAHSRALDLIALVELLGRPSLSADVVAELCALIERTVVG